jgi:hypothetical protein
MDIVWLIASFAFTFGVLALIVFAVARVAAMSRRHSLH